MADDDDDSRRRTGNLTSAQQQRQRMQMVKNGEEGVSVGAFGMLDGTGNFIKS